MEPSLQAIGDISVQRSLLSGRSLNRAKEKDTDKAAEDFVAMFMARMLQPMWEGIEVDETFGGGHGEEIMRSFLVQEYGRAMARSDTSGLTDAVKAEMIRMQSAGSGNSSAAGGVS